MVKAKDRLFVFVSFVLGFLFCELAFFEGIGIGLTIFLVLFYAATFWYLAGRPGGIRREGLWLLIPIALLGVSFVLNDNPVLAMLGFLLLVALIGYQLAMMTGCRLYKPFSFGILADLFHVCVALPVVNIPAPFKALKRDKASTGKLGTGAAVLIGALIAVPVLAVVLALLASADFVFEHALTGVLKFIGDNIAEYMIKIVFGLILSIPLFGLLNALRAGRRIEGLKIRVDADCLRFVSEGVTATLLTLLNTVYIVFIAVQFGYLFNAFSSILPAGLTYAGYARRGFFELLGVVCVNAAVLGACWFFGRREAKTAARYLKAAEVALAVLTLLLIASAAAKMAMYMGACGLTLPRVYVSWVLLVCAVVFTALIIKHFFPAFTLSRFCAIACVSLFLGLCFMNPDARVAQYNVDRYLSGQLKTVDIDTLRDLSDSAVPYAAKLLDAPDPAVALKARQLLHDWASTASFSGEPWQAWTVAHGSAALVLWENGITAEED